MDAMARAIISRCLGRHVRLPHLELPVAVGRERWLQARRCHLPAADRQRPDSSNLSRAPSNHTKKSKKNLIAEFIMKSMQKVIRWCDAPWTLKRCHGFIHGMDACENNPDASPIYDRIVADAQAWEVMAATVNFKFASIDRIHIARFYRSLHRHIPQRIINHRPSIICVIAYIAVIAIIMQPSIIDCLPLCTGALASELPCQVEGSRCERQAGRGGPRHDDRSGQRDGGCAQGD